MPFASDSWWFWRAYCLLRTLDWWRWSPWSQASMSYLPLLAFRPRPFKDPRLHNQQISTLFWINIVVGIALGALCVATAPVLVKFYHEPRLFWVTIAMAAGFVLNAAGVQHSAILQRQLRYVAVTAIELSAQLASIVVGIGMALAGFGYWALVGAAIISPAVSTAGMWIVTGWIPSAPKWEAGVNSMLRFGGTITLNTLIVYIAYKVMVPPNRSIEFTPASHLGAPGIQSLTIPLGVLTAGEMIAAPTGAR